MNGLILLLPPLVPILMALFAHRLESRWWLFSAALPALFVGLMVEEGSGITIPWMLLGMHFALDSTGRLFLLFGSLIWMLAALFISGRDLAPAATGYIKQTFLLALAGNGLLILAADMLTFYVGFALMGLSAYGLVRGRSQRARRAARVYLVFTLVGELALFVALLLLMVSGGSLLFEDLTAEPMPTIALALLLLGFGIKVALPGLHLWLPPAYTLAPVIGVTLLSGPMMKAGLLGWLRFLPFGTPLEPVWGNGLMLLGAAGVVLGMLIGVVQREPRAVLAYSSIAKMGLFSALVGFSLNHPQLAAGLLPVIVLLALHHLLVKPMLFMGLALWRRHGATAWLLPALVLLALSLAALPLTGGGAAKSVLSAALGEHLSGLLLLSGIAGVALMGRFLWLLKGSFDSAQQDPVTLLGWLLLLPVAVWTPFLWEAMAFEWKTLLPLTGGIALFLLGLVFRRWLGSLRFPIRLKGERIILSATQIHTDLPDTSNVLRQPWLLLKQALQPHSAVSDSPSNLALRSPAVWWLLLILALLGALSLTL
ncbi:MAG: proton-conducting transporter membrane subunit [Candidatus Thiodiazotropha endolucinida]